MGLEILMIAVFSMGYYSGYNSPSHDVSSTPAIEHIAKDQVEGIELASSDVSEIILPAKKSDGC